MADHYLPDSLPVPHPMDAGFDQPYFDGLKRERLVIQRCKGCQTWIWGPEHICHSCLAWDPAWIEVEPTGRIYAWTRVWSPGFVPLRPATPFLVALVELPGAGGVRMIGNVLGDRMQPLRIGDAVSGEFEHHEVNDYRYSLLHWRKVGGHHAGAGGRANS